MSTLWALPSLTRMNWIFAFCVQTTCPFQLHILSSVMNEPKGQSPITLPSQCAATVVTMFPPTKTFNRAQMKTRRTTTTCNKRKRKDLKIL
ncbi:hypothetical protein POTOM_006993 [Populus tomentosa]|uniref:Secreted protein n=1 Tax=Populus tomentosa TaxID=118781 RepID=A0A8X8AYK3_POPTO|nr:hypothetical protein POTOM_006993 [Populus tomentosa]